MDTWDNAQPDRDQPTGDLSAAAGSPKTDATGGVPTARDAAATSDAPAPGDAPLRADAPATGEVPLSGAAPTTPEAQLNRSLRSIAEGVTAGPRADLYPKVLARATRIRRRQRAVRAVSATAALVVAAALGPSVASELGMRGGDASAAPPPSAIVDLTSAYPAPTPTEGPAAVVAPTVPENALPWPSRGATVPAQAVDVAKSYLVDQAVRADAMGTEAAAAAPAPTATVSTLWAQVDENTAAPASTGHDGAAKAAVAPAPLKTWLYVMQGWTTAANGTSSQAQLLVGDYTQTGKSASMSVYAAPVTFAHVRPGSSDDADDARQIAELSVWLPQSNRLVVLGAPQTKTVLYARTGGALIPQKTVDGVAVFPRTVRKVKGHFADVIQVRDANNVALTPPDAWSAADFQLTGPESLWKSGGAGWVALEAPDKAAESSKKPSQEPSTLPSTVPPTVRRSVTPSDPSGRSAAPSAPSSAAK